MRKITIKTPGKLMVAGEFAVLEKHHPLIVMAVNRFVEATIEPSDISCVRLPDVEVPSARWDFLKNKVHIHHPSRRMAFVNQAMSSTLTYLKENNIHITPFTLTVKSELNDEKTGTKFGLGSSAAVVTSVVRSILLYFLKEKTTDELVFKIASIAHVRTQGNGSGADIAASTFGGVILYTSFQAEWLLDKCHKMKSISSLVEMDWEYLTIEKLSYPKEIQMVVGWTGKAASTKSLVKEVKKMDDRTAYEQFLQTSKKAVNKIVQGMKTDNETIFFEGIEENRKALAKMGEIAQVPIETKKLYILSKLAKKYKGAGKLSGAGGGDCGLAFLPKNASIEKLYREWEKHNIEPLPLQVFYKS